MRHATERRTLRFTPGEVAEVDEAIRTTLDAWRGWSHHCRNAILSWARGQLATTQYARTRKVPKAAHATDEELLSGKRRKGSSRKRTAA